MVTVINSYLQKVQQAVYNKSTILMIGLQQIYKPNNKSNKNWKLRTKLVHQVSKSQSLGLCLLYTK